MSELSLKNEICLFLISFEISAADFLLKKQQIMFVLAR